MRSTFPVAAAVLVLATAVHVANFAFTGGSFRFLDSGWVLSYPHILATFGYAAGLVAGIAGARAGGPDRRPWMLLGTVSGLLLADHVTRLHDVVPGGVALAVPLVVAMAALAIRLSLRTAHARPVLAGLALLGLATAFHLAFRRLAAVTPGELDAFELDWGFQVAVGLKESIELAGWIVLAPAILRLADVGLPRRRVTKTTA